MATVKIELSDHETATIWNALKAYEKTTDETIKNLQSSKKVKKKDKEDLIKELLEEKGDVNKLAKFFQKQMKF
jgi:F0F1-type ATP synthase delta subunit